MISMSSIFSVRPTYFFSFLLEPFITLPLCDFFQLDFLHLDKIRGALISHKNTNNLIIFSNLLSHYIVSLLYLIIRFLFLLGQLLSHVSATTSVKITG